MQFDREFDDQLRREEKKFNGDSKGRFWFQPDLALLCSHVLVLSRFESMSSSVSVSVSFENYRMVHPYEDSDSSEDEVDWQDTRRDPYRAGEAGSVVLCVDPVDPQVDLLSPCGSRETSDDAQERFQREGEEHHHQTRRGDLRAQEHGPDGERKSAPTESCSP